MIFMSWNMRLASDGDALDQVLKQSARVIDSDYGLDIISLQILR